jgi:acyl carrier protein
LNEDMLALVYAGIDEVNGQLRDRPAIEKRPDTRLLGSDQGLDSLTFVNLVVAIEEQVRTKRGVSVLLVDEDSMGSQEHPFRTVNSLAAYLERLLSRQPQA